VPFRRSARHTVEPEVLMHKISTPCAA